MRKKGRIRGSNNDVIINIVQPLMLHLLSIEGKSLRTSEYFHFQEILILKHPLNPLR